MTLNMMREMFLEFTSEFSDWEPHIDERGWIRAKHSTFTKERGGYGWWIIWMLERGDPNQIKLTGYDLMGETYTQHYDLRHPTSLDHLKEEILKLEAVIGDARPHLC